MPKPFYSIALRKTSLFIQALGLLPFLSGPVHADDEDKPEWTQTPPQTKLFYPIAYQGNGVPPVTFTVTGSSQYIPVVDSEGNPTLLPSPGPGQVPSTRVERNLNTFLPYPVTSYSIQVRGRELRVTTVGATGYRTINSMETDEMMRERHEFLMEQFRLNDNDSFISSITIDRSLLDSILSKPGGSNNRYEKLLEDRRISGMFTNDQGELNDASLSFNKQFYQPSNRLFNERNRSQLGQDATRLTPSYEARASSVAANVIRTRTDVLNIVRTNTEELEAIINALNNHPGVTARLISASQHGAFRSSIEELNEHATRTDQQGGTRQAMITDAYITIEYSDGSAAAGAIAVNPTEIPNVGPSQGYAGNLQLPAAILLPNLGLLLISSLTGPADNEVARTKTLANIRNILDTYPELRALLTTFTPKANTAESEQKTLLGFRKDSYLLKDCMPNFYLGLGNDIYSASNPLIKLFLKILLERSSYINSHDFFETKGKKDDDDKDPGKNLPGPSPSGLPGTIPASGNGKF